MADLDQCLKIDPQETAGYEGRGNLKAQMGDKTGAIQDYQKAIEIGATTGETYWSKQAKEELKVLQSK
jgi:regulator of sirC expression with transglutaminase-like and TPR domain